MSDKFNVLPLALLSPDPSQPRRELESDSPSVTEAATLQGLAHSIREVGILQPIRLHAVPAEDGSTRYTIVSGQRRYEAAKMLGLETVPCLVVDNPTDASHTLVSQVTENLQRKAMTATELALAVRALVDTGAKQDDVAKKLGIQPSQVTLLLNLLVLSGPVKTAFAQGRIDSPRAAYDLNKLPPALQAQLIDESAQKNRVVTQRDVREVKLLHAKQNSQRPHRFDAPTITQQEYLNFEMCLNDGVVDHYDPTSDRTDVFGHDWRDVESRQLAGLQAPPHGTDTVDFERVRVPGFSLNRVQAEHLFALLGKTDTARQATAELPPAEVSKELGKKLSDLLSAIGQPQI